MSSSQSRIISNTPLYHNMSYCFVSDLSERLVFAKPLHTTWLGCECVVGNCTIPWLSWESFIVEPGVGGEKLVFTLP